MLPPRLSQSLPAKDSGLTLGRGVCAPWRFGDGTTNVRTRLGPRSNAAPGEMRMSRRVPKTRPQRNISQRSLKERMSEIISLRERLAQAELQAGRVPTRVPELVFDEPQTHENA
jgi:hypothetical protein